ncbi:MAG: ABC transporter ATP-binding protein [Opitutaceae bacterium]|jgi:ABC-type lipoprotein export system ATPase subunit|nr:ABC transporter ATP-binding protein [Opitutaceae bacterium]
MALGDEVLRMERVGKRYPMGDTVVDALVDASFVLSEGEAVAILGPSGSGKSTLMHLLGFLDSPSSGEILFEGRPVAALTERQRARVRAEKIGFVFQAFNLLPRLTVRANVALPLAYLGHPPPDAEARVDRALALVGMSNRAHHKPGELSGGQRQRVAIARALVNEPRILLADEPTGNLDTKTAAAILELFQELNRQGRTIVVVTHSPEIAGHFRRQLHVLDGRVAEKGAAS